MKIVEPFRNITLMRLWKNVNLDALNEGNIAEFVGENQAFSSKFG
jgi:hypothetical protein